MTACAPELRKRNFTSVFNECLSFMVAYATSEGAQEFFGGPATPHGVAVASGGAYVLEFLQQWARCVQLEKEGKNSQIVDVICCMIRNTESNTPAAPGDLERLADLALQVDCQLPTMRGAFVELANG